jgi:hypothetical protein
VRAGCDPSAVAPRGHRVSRRRKGTRPQTRGTELTPCRQQGMGGRAVNSHRCRTRHRRQPPAGWRFAFPRPAAKETAYPERG